LIVPTLDKYIGIEVYTSRSSGIGGVIRRNVKDFTVEETLVDGSKAAINATEHDSASSVLGSSDVKSRYLLCVMVKRNWDTLMALKKIATDLGVGADQIQIAGIKDAKAVTAQHITIEKVSFELMQRINIKDIEVRPIGYLRSKLSSYYAFGNSFNIRVRDVSLSKPTLKKRTHRILNETNAVGGIPNFFGYQRFGTSRPITHLVGKAIVEGDFKKAAIIFLAKSSPHEHPEAKQSREELEATQDFGKAWKIFPRQLRYERLMLRHLVKKRNDFIGAFRRLPTKLQELFVQAHQSHLFNKFLSARVRNGIALNVAEVGDYVVNVERTGLPMLTMYKMTNALELGKIGSLIEAGKMRLAIPIVGFKQQISQGVQGEIEKRILEEEDVCLEDFKIATIRRMSARGSLRPAVVQIDDFSTNQVSDESTNSTKCIVEMSFALHRGSYASIAMRELMKPRNPVKAGF
jgi:tRNA pseudouridine13 synthase